MCPLVLGVILGLFVNILTADDKYPVQDCHNLQLRILMQLSEKPKTISQFFLFHYWSLHQILNLFLKKDDRHS